MHWKVTTALICVYGVLKEFRPATPFLTPYLTSQNKNLTLDEVYGQVFPFWTYSYMIFLIPIFFLTDIFRYKPIIILESTCLCLTWALLVWGEGVRQMQLMQICFGLASSSEIAYYSYMYAIVDEKKYRRITSYIRSAALVGKLSAFGFAQVLVSTRSGSYLLLNQISLVAVCIVFFVAIALPGVPSPGVRHEFQKEFVSNQDDPPEEQNLTTDSRLGEVERRKLGRGARNYLVTTLKNFQIFKQNMIILKWSAWWALASCGIFQVYNYIQALWLEMQANPDNVENGLTEFMNTLVGAILAFTIQFATIDWIKYGELTLALSSCLIAVILAIISQTNYIVIAYIGYVCATSIYHTLITAASCNIATELTSTNYGLVFGWNTFVAVVLQTLLTILVADSHGLNLDMRKQFVVYAAYFAAVGAIFFVVLVWSKCKKTPANKAAGINQENVENVQE